MARKSLSWRWLNEPLGGREAPAIRAEMEESQREPPLTAEREGPQPDAAPTTSPAAEIEIGRVHAVFEFSDDVAAHTGPEARTTSQDARRRLEDNRGDLEEMCELSIVRVLGPEARCGTILIREGASVEVIVPVLVMAVTQSPWLGEAMNAVTQGVVSAVRRILRLGAPPAVPASATSYFAPAQALLQPAAAEAAAPEEPADSGIGRWLVGAGAFMTATLAVIGVTTTDLDPVRINDGTEFSIMFAVVIFGILFGVMWPLLRGVIKRLYVLVLLFVVGAVGFAIWDIARLTTDSLSAKATPRIDVDMKQDGSGTRLAGTVVADGLMNEEQMRVRVVGLDPGSGPGDVIHDVRAGPTVDGKAEVKLNVPVAVGLYDRVDVNADLTPRKGDLPPRCASEAGTFGCVVALVPLASRQPKLVARWKTPEQGRPRLRVTARMAGLAITDRAQLVVRSRRKDGRLGRRLYAATWTAVADGLLEETIEVPIRQRKRSVCVVMRALRDTDKVSALSANPYGPCTARAGGASVLVAPPPRPS